MLRLKLFKLKVPSRFMGIETDYVVALFCGWVFGSNFDFKLFPMSNLVTPLLWAGIAYFVTSKIKYHLPGQRIIHFAKWIIQTRHYTPTRDEYPIPLVLPDELFDSNYTRTRIKAQLQQSKKIKPIRQPLPITTTIKAQR
jgi:hypothetical protein